MQVFEWTHELTTTFGAAWWSMVRLPAVGGLGAQDARLMAALAVARGQHNALLLRTARTGDPDQEREAFHEQVRQRRV